MVDVNEPQKTAAERYIAACHAMQTGVAMVMNYESDFTSPKLLRVGVNAAMVEHAALVSLLIEMGWISREKYEESLAAGMEAEARRYEGIIADRVGIKGVTLY